MTTPEDLSEEIADKITLWLATHIASVRDAHSDDEKEAAEVKLRLYLNECGHADASIRNAGINLRQGVERAHMVLHPLKHH